MQTKCLLLAAICLLMTGCQPVDSLNPLYTDKDVIADSSLLGDWVSADPTEKGITRITEFSDSGLPAYKITILNPDGGSGEFEGHLVNLGGQHFLDVVLQNWGASSDSYILHVSQSKDQLSVAPRLLRLGTAAYMEFTGGKGGTIQSRLRPAHWFFRVTTDGHKLHLDSTDDEKLAQAIAAGDAHISHAFVSAQAFFGNKKTKDIVVTAGTKELQAFVLEHMDDEKIFSEHSDSLRRPPSSDSGSQTDK